MNRFIKTNSPWLGLLGLAVILVGLAFILRPRSPHYLLNAKETITLMKDLSTEVDSKDMMKKQLIDIRSAELYSKGHPANAMNIPVRQLLDKASLELFDHLLEKGKDAVLYGNDELQVTAPLFLLRQIGYKNLKLLKGGISSTNIFNPTSLASTEVSIIDTAAIHGKGEQMNFPVTTIAKKKGETVIPVRKATSAGGGC